MSRTAIQFYPEHPSPEKTHQLETQDSPLLRQNGPVASAELHDLFSRDFDNALGMYQDKRFEIEGVAIRVGPDGHNKPSVQLSDGPDGKCHALCVFPSTEVFDRVSVGDRVVIRGNYLVLCNLYGIVLKKCEVITA